MNKNRQFVPVPWWLVERADLWAEILVAKNKTGRGSAATLAVAGDGGTEFSQPRQNGEKTSHGAETGSPVRDLAQDKTEHLGRSRSRKTRFWPAR
jgi:hypothetical protein